MYKGGKGLGNFSRIKRLLFLLVLIVGMIHNDPVCSAKGTVKKEKVLEANPVVSVKLGIDNIDKGMTVFDGKRVGLITNSTGMNSRFESTVDV